jgi:signal transduction histidine kinase/ActR/RegA family two-component response regulator
VIVAILGVLAAWGTWILLSPVIGDRVPFITFFPMIFLVAWWGGFRPTLFATFLSALLLAYAILEPTYSFHIERPEYRIGLVVFIAVALATGWLGENLHAARWAAEHAADKAIGEREQLSVSMTDRKRVEEALSFLAEASNTLAALADRESTLRQAVRLPIPYLADWCVIYVVDENGAIDYHAHAHRDPSKESLLDRMLAGSPLDWTSNTATVQSLRTGQSQLMSELPEAFLDSVAQSEEHRAIIRELGPRAVISVPLKIRERIVGVMGLVSCDERRQYTKREVRLAESLAERVSTAVDNARLFHAVKEASRQKDEFLAMLAHELRNPLAAIRYAIALGQLSPDEPTGELFEVIDRQTQNLGHLIDDLLDVSRISRDKVTLRKEHIDLATIVNRAAVMARPLMDQKRHEFVLDLAQQPLPVYVDATRAEQIVANLLTNAAKYTGEGGRVTLRLFRDDGAAIIKVVDTGIGLPPEMLTRVFDLFAQADRTLDRSEGGLGIGLTVARRLAEMHGGSISAASEGLGNGSTFTVRLPLAETAVVADAVPGKVVRRNGAPRKLRILVVDDHRDAANSCALLLRAMGHEVEIAFDGIAAIEHAREFKPQVLLLDIGLPAMNGYDVARTLRSEGFEQAVMVAVSGYGQPEDRKRSHDAGFDHHLVKPVDQATLSAVLEDVGQPVTSP